MLERWLDAFGPRYGSLVWTLGAIALATVFVFGALRPRQKREWRSLGWAQAFVVALYAEMYGIPLTAYALAGLLDDTAFVDDHFHGHAWAYVFGWGDPGAVAIDVIGQTLIAIGALIALWGWRALHGAGEAMAQRGPYRWIRHPQYLGFFLFLTGSVINWPTFLTLLMYPFLLCVYIRLAKVEEGDSEVRFGSDYIRYRDRSGMFLPRWSR